MKNIRSKVQTIFETARKIDTPEARRAYLEQACGEDSALQNEVEALLRSYEESESFLESPPPELGPTLNRPDMSEQPGTQIGPYKLREQIGEGGFGAVYVAEQLDPVRRKVALKIIKPGMDSKDVIARFEAERQALAIMDHPNVARVLDAGSTETGRPFFVMELVQGVPITEFCDTNHLNTHQRLELFVDVCRAVQHAHQKGIIHRDLKPGNIMVTLHDGRPVPKVIDFGVAKALSRHLTEKTIYTRYGQMVGTPVYMSPEQAEMSGLGIDTRSDIYSLGVLLYELLTGKTPIDAERLRSSGYAEMLRIIREEEPQRPSLKISTIGDEATSIAAHRQTDRKKLGQCLRGELDWIVMKALDKDRDRRYESANLFAADVEHYLHEEPVQACPPSAAYKFRKFTRRHRVAIATVSMIAGILVVATAVSIWQAYRANKASRELLAMDRERTQLLDRALRSEKLAKARLQQVESEKKRVEQERAVTQAVHDFLGNELTGLDEIAARPRSVRGMQAGPGYPEILDRAARGLEDRFPNQPLSEAAVRMAIGENYRLLRQFQKARKHMQRSVELWTEVLGPDDTNTLDGKWHLAGLYQDEEKYELAEPLLKEVIQAYTDQNGVGAPATLTSKNSLALLYHEQQEFDRAELLYREALEQAEVNLSEDDELTLVLKSNLAALHSDRDRFDEAQSLLEQILQSRIARHGPNYHKTRLTIEELVSVYRKQGLPDKAERLLKRLPKARSAEQFRGPINAAFVTAAVADRADLVIIAPTAESSQSDREKIDAHIEFMAKRLKDKFENPPRVLSDQEALKADLSNSILMVYGTPKGNLWLSANVPELAERFKTVCRMAHQNEDSADDLRFISAWPNPFNPNRGVVIYTAARAENIADINSVFHGPYDYVLARGRYNLRTGNYRKRENSWSLAPQSKPHLRNRNIE